MSASMNRDKVSLLDKIQEAIGIAKNKYALQQFRFTGDASTTEFVMDSGWKPVMVFGTAGDIKLEGSADDYTVSGGGLFYTITFAVAPSAADFTVVAERVLK